MNEITSLTRAKLVSVTNASVTELKSVYNEVAKKEYARFAKVTAGVKFAENKVVQRAIDAQFRVTAGAMTNLANTTARTLNYKPLLDKAIQAVTGGLVDYNSAIRGLTSAYVAKGLNYIEYDTGYTRRLDSAVRMNVLEGVRQVGIETNAVIGQDYGADGVEISAHALSAPDHIDIQGKQFTNENFELMQNKQPFEDIDGNEYEPLARAIGTLNCKHFAFRVIIGLSEPKDKEELDKYKELSEKSITIDGREKTRYEWTQEARRLEVASRDRYDLVSFYKESGDKLGETRAREERRIILDRYEKLTEKANISYRQDLLT